MKWRADSENSENSALDTIIVSHKIYEKKIFFHRFDFTSSDSPLKQPTGAPSSKAGTRGGTIDIKVCSSS
jgi:hypothetical protein